MFDLEHDFFKDFEVHMDEERDPYYNADADFRIKDNDFDSLNSLLFFDWCFVILIFILNIYFSEI